MTSARWHAPSKSGFNLKGPYVGAAALLAPGAADDDASIVGMRMHPAADPNSHDESVVAASGATHHHCFCEFLSIGVTDFDVMMAARTYFGRSKSWSKRRI